MHPINQAEASTLALQWADESGTQSAAERLAVALLALPTPLHAIIELHGGLGAGKTTFIRHLLRALGVQGRIKSPTYAVVEPYEIAWRQGETAPPQTPPLNAWHFDFYRFKHPSEFTEAGFGDLFAQPGLKLAEWPQQAAGELPTADLQLHLAPSPASELGRSVRLVANTPTGARLLQALAA
jgi:tRNA threonylcarbamoyladenosine biosynthesis protein TsaE